MYKSAGLHTMLRISVTRKPHKEITQAELAKIRPVVNDIMRDGIRIFLQVMASHVHVESGMTRGTIVGKADIFRAVIGMSRSGSGGKKKTKNAYLWSGNRFKGQRATYQPGTPKTAALGESLSYSASDYDTLFDNNRCTVRFSWYYTAPQHLFNDGVWNSAEYAANAMQEFINTEGRLRLNEYYKKLIFG